MKTHKILGLACATLLLLSACGGWKKDPLEGKPDRFGDGVPVPRKPDGTKPVNSDAILINVPRSVTFEEGTANEFEIRARVLIEGYKAAIEIANLDEFPGARYDQATNKFTWTPPAGYVDSKSAGGVTVDQKLQVVVNAQRGAEDAILHGTDELTLVVSREYRTPEITRIDTPQNWVREGESMQVAVFVTDRDADANDRNTWPELILQTTGGAKNLSGFLATSNVNSLSNGLYRVNLLLDLRQAELTSGIDASQTNLVAVSRFKKSGSPRRLDLNIYTSFAMPTTNWTDEVSVVAGQTLSHNFFVLDPKQEALLTLERTISVPTGGQIQCASTARGMMNCSFTWTPTEDQVGSYSMSANIQSRNIDARDNVRVVKTLNLRARVLPKGP